MYVNSGSMWARKRAVSVMMLVMLSLPGAAMAEQLIDTFRGSRSTSTLEFEVRAPWILDWRVSGDGNRVAAVDVALFNAANGQHEGSVLKTKYPGNGVRMFDQSGRFYFRVDSALMEWTLKVIQLTPEEAELYTPKNNDLF